MSLTSLFALAVFAFPAPVTDAPSAPKAPVVEERRLSPVSVGARVGLAVPSGKLSGSTATSEIFGIAMTADLMLDVRLGRRVVLAPFAGYLKGAHGSRIACGNLGQNDCGAVGFRFGGMVRYTFLRTRGIDAWGGYGFAREWQSVLGQGNVAQFAGNQHHLSLGVDFFATDRNDTRLGFYVDLGIGKNDTGKVTLGGQGTRDVVDHELHQWTTLGGQVVF